MILGEFHQMASVHYFLDEIEKASTVEVLIAELEERIAANKMRKEALLL